MFRFSPIISIVLLLFCFISCRHSSKKNEQNIIDSLHVYKDTLVLSLPPITACMPIYYALDNQLFAKKRLYVSINTKFSQGDIDKTLLSGKTNGGYVDAYSPHYQKLSSTYSLWFPLEEDWVVVSNKMLRLKSIKDLEGRVVGLAKMSSANSFFAKVLQTQPKPKDVMTVNITDVCVLFKMLNNNQVDAAILSQPFATKAIIIGHNILFEKDIEGSPYSGIYIQTNNYELWAKQAFLEAYNQAVDSLNVYGNDALVPLFEKYAKMSIETVEKKPIMKFRSIQF